MKIISASALAATLSLGLAACGGGKDEANLSRLDAKLTANAVDPALREAIEAPIATDPDLKGEANRDAVRPSDKPLNGALPARLSLRDARAQALVLAGGKLIPAPDVTKTISSTGEPVTLAGKAAKQDGGRCGRVRVDYATGWASRMPATFPLYPGAQVVEAAGAANPPCNLRAVSFRTAIPPAEVMDFYHSLARRAGYSSEHVEENGDDVLSGTRDRDGGYYYLAVRPLDGGGSAVDLIANKGR